ncbi:hypothetical protein [Streptomyces sp. CAU 1734]|uniref:hypothetical protein n=1 Tax=Streptomyces sp. CAU 1734 TaxID=3140360 RepID=UPI0032606869
MTTPPEPVVTVARYEVSLLPETDINRHVFTLRVEYRGHSRWAVTDGHRCLAADGTWSWESIPSERADDWLDRHRHDLDTALDLAREYAPLIRVNGHTALDAYYATTEETP